jgi:hypothetical protein
MRIRYISWNYGRTRTGFRLHLVRYADESAKLFTDEQMVAAGLADWA